MSARSPVARPFAPPIMLGATIRRAASLGLSDVYVVILARLEHAFGDRSHLERPARRELPELLVLGIRLVAVHGRQLHAVERDWLGDILRPAALAVGDLLSPRLDATTHLVAAK